MSKRRGRIIFSRARNVPQGSRCIYCGGWAQVVEHIIPQLKPYPYPWNERYACSPCNLVKGDKQSRQIDVPELQRILSEHPSLHQSLRTVPVGREAGDDTNYAWYYGRFKPNHLWLGSWDWGILANVALALYEADIPVTGTIAKHIAAGRDQATTFKNLQGDG